VKGDGESPISSVVILSDFLPAGAVPVPVPGAKETPFDRESAA
jgi:hypothetical protein